MCGLVGVSGTINKKELEAFLNMLRVDTIRGEHSTGVGYVKRNKEMGYYKSVEPGWTFVDDPRLAKRIDDFGNTVLIGHNRWATRGKVISANAHPFMHGDILGAHNGTISNPDALSEGKTFQVDSQALIYDIDAEGLSQTLKKVYGAWALTYYNKENGTINFIRNEQRPLWMAMSEDGKTIWWASEPWMFEAGPLRSGIKLAEMSEIPVNTWIRWEVPEANAAFGKPFRRGGVVGKAAPAATSNFAGRNWWEERFGSNHNNVVGGDTSKVTPGGNVQKQVEKVESNVSVLPSPTDPTKRDHLSQQLTDEQYDKLVDCGCHWCGEKLFSNERPKFLRGYLENSMAPSTAWICPDCSTGMTSAEDFDDYNDLLRFSETSVPAKITAIN